MAHPHLKESLARFSARMHRTKNRLLAIPAEVQRVVGLERRPDNDILLVSLRKDGVGAWNNHYVKLTSDNEFAIPADVTAIGPGDQVEVKIRAVYSGTPKRARGAASSAALLIDLASTPRPGFRNDGSTNVDDYLNQSVHDSDIR